MMSVQANTGPPWAEKNTTAFWRGRDSRKERLELVKLSRAHPDMIDAAFTNFFFFKHDESLYGPLVKHVSFFDFFKVREAGFLTHQLACSYRHCTEGCENSRADFCFPYVSILSINTKLTSMAPWLRTDSRTC